MAGFFMSFGTSEEHAVSVGFPPLPVGKYQWTATVNGKIAAGDDFNR
jgi:hypothetical protein